MTDLKIATFPFRAPDKDRAAMSIGKEVERPSRMVEREEPMSPFNMIG
jgi:hypothetical protein